MNDKGQALVEFIIVAPILLLIFVALIDVGNIFIEKYELNNDLSTVAELYENNQNKEIAAYVAKEGITYKTENNGNFVKLILEENVPVSAPILSNILGDDFTITTSKNVYQGENNHG